MGLFSKGGWLSNSWNSIKVGVSSIPKTVSNVVHAVPIQSISKSVGSVATTIHNDAVSIANFAGKQIDKITDTPIKIAQLGSNTVTGLGKDVANIGSAISMPLAVGLGVAGIFLVGVLTKK